MDVVGIHPRAIAAREPAAPVAGGEHGGVDVHDHLVPVASGANARPGSEHRVGHEHERVRECSAAPRRCFRGSVLHLDR